MTCSNWAVAALVGPQIPEAAAHRAVHLFIHSSTLSTEPRTGDGASVTVGVSMDIPVVYDSLQLICKYWFKDFCGMN